MAQILHNNSALSSQATMLLNLISPDWNARKLATFAKTVLSSELLKEKEKISSRENLSNLPEDSDSDSVEDTDVDPLSALKSSEVYEDLKSDFNEDLLLAALIVCGTKDVDKLIEWCYDHSDDDDYYNIIRKYSSSTKPSSGKEKTFDENRKSGFRFLFDEKADGLVGDKLRDIWKQFLEKVNTLEITEYVSFQSLAKFFAELTNRQGTNLKRNFMNIFTEGCQNLVLCSEAEMHSLALSLYMQDPNKPLPRLDEVLICQKDTTREQIELICRRAFTDTSGKIFVILHAEYIDYDNGVYLENLIKNATISNIKYHLILLAVKEKNNDHSYILTAFDKYRKQMPLLPQKHQIQKYLLGHLYDETSRDPDKSFFRLVKSEQSGNGKSLVAKRLAEKIPDYKRNIIQLHDSAIDFNKVISSWVNDKGNSNVFHIDVTPLVEANQTDLIFSLAVLGGLSSSSGNIWIISKNDYYIVELTAVSKEKELDNHYVETKKEINQEYFENYV